MSTTSTAIKGLIQQKEQIYNKMFELLDKIEFNETNKLVVNGGNINHIGTINVQNDKLDTVKKLASLNRREGITLQQAMEDSFRRIQKNKNLS